MATPKQFRSTVRDVFSGRRQVQDRTKLKNTSGDPMCDRDFKDVRVASSWIASVQFQPNNKSSCDIYQKGDFILAVKTGSKKRYVYPNIQRRVFNDFLGAPSKGQFYWYGGGSSRPLRHYSNRTLVGKRMRRPGRMGTRRR
jgi:hypothetical protein